MTVLLAPCLPLTGFSEPDFDIKPKVSGSWMAESNYWRTEFEEKEVYTYLLRPGIDLAYKTAKSLVELDYTLDAYYFNDREPDVGGRLPNDYLGQEYWINRLTPRVVYRFGRRFTAGARYRWTELDYTREEMEDSTEHRGIFDLIYSLNSRAHLDLQYQHWGMNYDKDTSDYVSDQIELLFKKQFHYVTLVAGGGYQDRRFDDPDQKNMGTPTFKIGFDAQNPPAGGRLRSYGSLYFIQDLPIWHDMGDYYVARRVALDAGYVIKRRVPLRIAAAYQNSDYDRFMGLTPSGNIEKRNDDGYGFQGSLGYLFTDRILLSATAGYEKRDSNLVGLSYENQYVMIELSFAYEIGHRPALHFPF